MTHAISSVATPGDLATVANLHQHFPEDLTALDRTLETVLGKRLSPEAGRNEAYEGPGRIIVPTLRTAIESGEGLCLKVMIMSSGAGRADETLPTGSLFWRPLGKGDFNEIPLVHVARRVYQAKLPAPRPVLRQSNIIFRQIAAGKPSIFQQRRPMLNQTVVVLE